MCCSGDSAYVNILKHSDIIEDMRELTAHLLKLLWAKTQAGKAGDVFNFGIG